MFGANKTQSRPISLIFWVGFFAILLLGTYLVAESVDDDIGMVKTHLKLSINVFAAAINPDRVKNLSGTEADFKNPDYLRLREQFTLVAERIDKARYVYLMKQNPDNHRIQFMVDSQPSLYTNPNDLTSPGEYYADAPQAALEAFNTKEASITKEPYRDKWGSFYTAYAPIFNKEDKATLGVVAVDINSGEIDSIRTNIYKKDGGFLFFVFLIYTLSFLLLKERINSLERSGGQE